MRIGLSGPVHGCYVYILSNEWLTIYVGIAEDLLERLGQHKMGMTPFTARYKINRLVYFEHHPTRAAAAKREKEIKGWKRYKKVALIRGMNPEWRDLAEDPYQMRDLPR